jgi:hypothetical protein
MTPAFDPSAKECFDTTAKNLKNNRTSPLDYRFDDELKKSHAGDDERDRTLPKDM